MHKIEMRDKLRIGIDIGGTFIKAGIVNENREILYRIRKATVKGDGSVIISDIVDMVNSLLKMANITYEKIETIGVGSPGIIDSAAGVIVCSGNLGLSNFTLKELLEKELRLPVFVNNDANCATLAEYHFLEHLDINSFVMLTLGTGIGGGIILNHKIYEGCDGSAGEFGGMVIYPNGCRDCWENYASARALIERAEHAAEDNPQSLLSTLMKANGGRVSGEIVFSAIEQKDSVAEIVFREYIKYLGDGIISILYIFRPDIIAIGGGISQASQLWGPLMEYIAQNSNWKQQKKPTKICNARLGNDAGIIGAAYLKEYV